MRWCCAICKSHTMCSMKCFRVNVDDNFVFEIAINVYVCHNVTLPNDA